MPEKLKTISENPALAKYISEFTEDVKLSEYNLREKSLMCSSIWAKWIQYLFLEKENLQRISNTKQKILKHKMQQRQNDSILRMRSEDKILENDETIQKLAAFSRQTQDNIDYIERILNIL